MAAVFGNDMLLEEILKQLDGEMTTNMRLWADGGGPHPACQTAQASVAAAHDAALASRLVCWRWRGHGDEALASTCIRLRLAVVQTRAAFYARFLVRGIGAAEQRQRSGRPDATPAQLLSSPTDYLVRAFENSIQPLSGGTAAAATDLILHLRKNGIMRPFVVVAAPKKLAAWERHFLGVFSLYIIASPADRIAFEAREYQRDGIIVSYEVVGDWLQQVHLSYVLLDDARTFMWRPALDSLFNPHSDRTVLNGTVCLLLDDFHASPCSLFELFHLVHFNWRPYSNPLTLQARVMQALDAFAFTPSVVDRLLRPQLEAALRHSILW